MNYRIIPVTAFAQNCSLIWCGQTRLAALVDPGRADCNDADAEIARARSAIELWYHLAMAGRAPEDVADRDHLRLTGMLLRAPTAEQRSWQQ